MKAMALKTTSFVRKNFEPALYLGGQTNYVRKHRTIKSHAKDVRFSFVKFYAVFCEPAWLLSQIKNFFSISMSSLGLQLKLFIGLTCNRVTLCRSSSLEGAENPTSSSHSCLCVSFVKDYTQTLKNKLSSARTCSANIIWRGQKILGLYRNAKKQSIKSCPHM